MAPLDDILDAPAGGPAAEHRVGGGRDDASTPPPSGPVALDATRRFVDGYYASVPDRMAAIELDKDRCAWGVQSEPESRWVASAAVFAAALLYVTLPERFTFGPVWLLPVLELALLVPLAVTVPTRHARETAVAERIGFRVAVVAGGQARQTSRRWCGW